MTISMSLLVQSAGPSRAYADQPLSAKTIALVTLAHAGVLALLMASSQLHQTEPSVLSVRMIAPQPLAMAAPQPTEPRPAQARPVTPKPRPKTVPQIPVPAPVLAAAPVDPAPAQAEAPIVAPPVPQAATSGHTSGSGSGSLTSAPSPESGTFVQARFDAGYLQNPAPVYPAMSRRLGEEGRVMLRVFVESSGSPSKLEIRTSSGSSRLDQSALEAVRRWKFVPARRGDEAVAAWVVVPIVFNLRG